MPPATRTLDMTARERLVSAYVTGPLGHLVAGSIDLVLAIGRMLYARASAALTRAAGRSPRR